MGEAEIHSGDPSGITYEKVIMRYKATKLTMHPNLFKTELNILPVTKEGADVFNAIVELAKSLGLKKGLPFTRSGGISTTNPLKWMDRYDIKVSSSTVELIICHEHWIRIAFRRNYRKDPDGINGHRSFCKFLDVCRKFDVDIDKLRISTEEGKAVKTMIPRPLIDINPGIENQTFDNVHHIDIHSSHMAGMAFEYPELFDVINYCYQNRHTAPIYKHILTHTWGYMQSQYTPVYYQLSHLSKAGIEYTNRTVNDLTKRLIESGRKILIRNTDGIWYTGEIYHGDGEGKNLGDWENDHINCIFRAKSKGAYEYIEKGQYYPVVRGRTELDKVKSRERWGWGDIYNTGKYDCFVYDPETEHIIHKEAEE